MLDPQSHVVAIYDESDTCAVAPGQLLAAIGDSVIFTNLTHGQVTLVFPDNSLFGSTDLVKLEAGTDTVLVINEMEAGSYPYTVYRNSKKEFAHASIPIIIVYPRK
jgi:hypothetical protein